MKTIPLALVAMTLAASLPGRSQDMRMFLGSPVPVSPNQRGIVLNADTRWVNVSQGEEVRFVAGNTQFSWKFDGPGARPVDLQQVAPPGILNRPVIAYVAGSPGHPSR